MNEVRIHKYLSDTGVISRRKAEEAVAQGRVRINGVKAETGQKINPDTDIVLFNGVKVESAGHKRVYISFYKPAGVVTTMADEQNRKCIADYFREFNKRVYPVGRLDMYSEGLLILTDDGETANKLIHPSAKNKTAVKKLYHIKLKGELERDTINNLAKPIEIDGKMTLPAKVSVVERKEGITVLRFEIIEGKNRQLRRLCERESLIILKLKRISIGAINIGTLKPGEWKYMNFNEIKYLKSL